MGRARPSGTGTQPARTDEPRGSRHLRPSGPGGETVAPSGCQGPAPAKRSPQITAPKPKPLAKVKEAPSAKPAAQQAKVRPTAATATAQVTRPPARPEPAKIVAEVKPEPPKVELPKAVEAPKPVEPAKAVAEAKPEPPKVELPKVVEAPKPVEPAKVVAEVKPEPPKVELPKVVEAPKPVEPAKIVAEVKPEPTKIEPPKVVEAVKPEPVKTVEAPKAELPPPTTLLAAVPSAPPPPMAAAAPLRKGDNSLTIPFAIDSARLSEATRAELERMAHRMERDESLSLQLLAYAAGDEANASKARRLSLSRALEVRKYLMEMGVRSTRIEVRALGNKVEDGAPDRVDAVLARR
ncbi:OmpA family protein [Magnetospirillum fulvum]|uniref:Lysophospholipase n=1 Tax=Magnetospirillum fulvum MGU-K5 TaxID=1316936 RepID=S9SAZ6_MAGFU|nr:OmpA family protein [Magnetospirillum fulvum]EPY01884.1 lysophospholipase [Magnetospirillum fulvum MGU-K5]